MWLRADDEVAPAELEGDVELTFRPEHDHILALARPKNVDDLMGAGFMEDSDVSTVLSVAVELI